jgi:hypothetical protein
MRPRANAPKPPTPFGATIKRGRGEHLGKEAVRSLATTPLGWQELRRYASAAQFLPRSPRVSGGSRSAALHAYGYQQEPVVPVWLRFLCFVLGVVSHCIFGS